MKLEFGKFVRVALCAAAAALAAECGAAGIATAEPGVSQYADAEASAWCALPPWKGDCEEELTISVEGVNTPTNEWEVWFCLWKHAEPCSCSRIIGFDCGRYFFVGSDFFPYEEVAAYALPPGASTDGADTESHGEDSGEEPFLGAFKLEVTLRRSADGEVRLSRVSLTDSKSAPRRTTIREDLSEFSEHIQEWRSVRLIARGCETPPTLTVRNSKVGTKICIVSAGDAADSETIAAVR